MPINIHKPRTIKVGLAMLCATWLIDLGASVFGPNTDDPHLNRVIATISEFIAFGLVAFLILKIATGRNWARILYLVLGLYSDYSQLSEFFGPDTHIDLRTLLSSAIELVGLVLLFTPSAGKWFLRENAPVTADG